MELMEPIETGDRVRLIRGGPIMIVSKVGNDDVVVIDWFNLVPKTRLLTDIISNIFCFWIDNDLNHHSDWFDKAVLEKA
jgi:uncharacterized protein YodC (DUF2158 family)